MELLVIFSASLTTAVVLFVMKGPGPQTVHLFFEDLILA